MHIVSELSRTQGPLRTQGPSRTDGSSHTENSPRTHRFSSLIALALLGGCADSRTPLRVYAASSLTDVLADLERDYESAHPDTDVRVSLAGSQVLRLQIAQGAPADVFLSANLDHIQALERDGHLQAPLPFATNDLVLITPLSNPAGLTGLWDLPHAQRIVLGTEDVPVGRYARDVLTRADQTGEPTFSDTVLSRVVSQESNVRLLRAKVALGEADAAFVYRTDARGPNLRVLPIDDALNAQATYAAGLVLRSPHPAEAARWLDFLTSDTGRATLTAHGFGTP